MMHPKNASFRRKPESSKKKFRAADNLEVILSCGAGYI